MNIKRIRGLREWISEADNPFSDLSESSVRADLLALLNSEEGRLEARARLGEQSEATLTAPRVKDAELLMFIDCILCGSEAENYDLADMPKYFQAIKDRLAAPPSPSASLIDAVRGIYYAAVWHPDRPVANEAGLWEKLRDAAGFSKGLSPKPASSPTAEFMAAVDGLMKAEREPGFWGHPPWYSAKAAVESARAKCGRAELPAPVAPPTTAGPTTGSPSVSMSEISEFVNRLPVLRSDHPDAIGKSIDFVRSIGVRVRVEGE